MKIHTFILGDLQTNAYLLEQDGEAIIIDPADDASFLLEEMSRRRLELAALIATHGHFDHILAAGEIQTSLSVALYIHPKDTFLLNRLPETAKYFLGYSPIIIPPTSIAHLTAGACHISSFHFQVIETPGHTPGCASLYFEEEQCVFTGDTLFLGSVGRTDLSYSSKKDLHTSLKKLSNLPGETLVYPGHGEITSIHNEKSVLHLF